MTKNKIWKMVISVGIALILWSYVVTVVSPGSTKEYKKVLVDPNNLTGLSDDLIITEYESTVDVKLEGNRIDLNQLDSSSIVIEADLSGIQTADTHHIDYTVRTKGNFASNAFVVKESSPERLTVKVERKKTAKIAVEVVTINEPPDGFDYEEIIQETDFLMVSGPESAINRIKYAVITIDLKNAEDTINQSFAYTWCDSEKNPLEDINLDLIQADKDEVEVTIPITLGMELPLGVNLIEGGGIWKEYCKVTFSPIDKLNVYGTPDVIREIESLILGDIKLSDVPINATYWEQTFELDATKFENIKVPQGGNLPETITVRVDFDNLGTRRMQIPASQMTVSGDQEMDVTILSESVEIELRGDKTQLDQLKLSDISVVLDVSGKNTGISQIVAKISVNESFTKVAVPIKYQVKVDLAPKS